MDIDTVLIVSAVDMRSQRRRYYASESVGSLM